MADSESSAREFMEDAIAELQLKIVGYRSLTMTDHLCTLYGVTLASSDSGIKIGLVDRIFLHPQSVKVALD